MGTVKTKFGTNVLSLPQVDFGVSGIVFDIPSATITGKFLDYPNSFRADGDVKRINSLQQALSLGINDDHRDETKATGGIVTVAQVCTEGEIVRLYIKPKMGNKKLLAELVITSAMTTTALIAASLSSAVNLLTYSHGFTATYTTGSTFDLTAPSKLGASINTTGLSCEVYNATGTLNNTTDCTFTQFSTGAGSQIAVLYYHLKRAFLRNPNIVIWLKLKNAPAASDLTALRNVATSNIYQYWVKIKTTSIATNGSNIAGIVSGYESVMQTLENNNKYGIVCLTLDAYNGTAMTDSNLSNLINQRLGKKHVTVDIGLSGASDDYFKGDYTATISEGFMLQGISDYSIGTGGDWLGNRTAIKCNESVGSFALCNLQTDGEYLTPAFSNGLSYSYMANYAENSVKPSGTLEVGGYLFPRSDERFTGVYFCGDQNCETYGQPYDETKSLLTVYKFATLVVGASKELVESQVIKDPKTGKLTPSSRAILGSPCELVKQTMKDSVEISDAEYVVSDTMIDKNVPVNVEITPTYTVKTLTYNINLK